MPLILSYREKIETERRNKARRARALGKMSAMALTLTIGVTLKSEPELRESLRGIAMPMGAIEATRRDGRSAKSADQIALVDRATTNERDAPQPALASTTHAQVDLVTRRGPARHILH